MSSPTDDQKKSKSNNVSEYVKLNVGGSLFHSTVSTLTKFGENMLAAMFSGRMDTQIDEEGWVLIDRCGKHFGVILNFLRDGTATLPNKKKDLAELRAEANYFCISHLVELCDQALSAPMKILDIGLSPFLALAEPLEAEGIKSFTKPTIVLELSRFDTSNPFQHLLFFEKLSFEFHEHILFIRYCSSRNFHIWKFYSNGMLVKEIGFDSLVESEIYNQLAKLLQSVIPKTFID